MHTLQSILLITTDPLADIKKQFDIDVVHPDVDTLVIVPEPTIGIESIRNLKGFTSRRPLKHPTKSIIILDAQLLTTEAQNALLKLLEEPPDYLTVILAAPHTHTFLETILSRCQLVRTDNPTITQSDSTTTLTTLLTLPPPARLKIIPPDTKVRLATVSYCQQLIKAAEIILHQTPTVASTENLQILTDCLNNLNANANPTLCLTDAILRLQGETSLATMAKLPEKNRELD